MHVLTFEITDQTYAVDIWETHDVIAMIAIKPVLAAPGFLEGVINLRGVVIPIIDLAKRMGYSRSYYTYGNRIIISKLESALVGFVVDRVVEILDLPSDSIRTSKIKVDGQEFSCDMAVLDGREIIQIVRWEFFLNRRELVQLSHLQSTLLAGPEASSESARI
ncbi:MAG: purine-binding chemotaxis protein CheW [Deltaproteobacteria bacterium]|nr:purine-binding chemotaxis protein CheW [Deltaproteobacteria bacterium]